MNLKSILSIAVTVGYILIKAVEIAQREGLLKPKPEDNPPIDGSKTE